MGSYRSKPSRTERSKALAGVVGVYCALGGLLWLVRGESRPPVAEREPTVLIDIAEPEPPSPREETAPRAPDEEGAAGRKAEPTPVAAPEPRVYLPAAVPVASAPAPGVGAATTAGAASAGTGPGAGGSGSGRGGGGSGGSGSGIGTEARLLGGHRARLPSSLLRQFATDRGFAHVLLTVSGNGRVIECEILQSSGIPAVDQALCGVMVERSRWSPARDRDGTPITVKIRYTATWSKD
ncbi:energy transducer TonB family protein [Sphingomonas xanthus]|uniref:Energy transducer TonB n=1 Tax=Sphingomonas xanthus TaxID=2594473 RepID=A0A516IQD2_9SPHN|nr:energy transducer TonB [Sphingomonas xanthus]QDP18974.1 energy transducer TonB [Sphingomonas xanthus]